MSDVGFTLVLLSLLSLGFFLVGAWAGYNFRNKEVKHFRKEIRNQKQLIEAIRWNTPK